MNGGEEVEEQPNTKSSSEGEGEDEGDGDVRMTSWAVLERLPTRSRMRRGILLAADGEEQGKNREIDVKKLGPTQRQKLLERVLEINNAEKGRNPTLLLKLKDRMNRVGLEVPTTEVRFEHLSVEAKAYLGSRASPTMLNFSINMLEGLLNCFHILPSKKKLVPIIHDASGIVKPRRMTLLLGPPGSGKTTLLLALAGKLGKDHLEISGRVTYNGQGMGEFVPQRTAAYVSQHDLHIPELTVRETLAFAARCQGVGQRYGTFKPFTPLLLYHFFLCTVYIHFSFPYSVTALSINQTNNSSVFD